MAVSSYVKEGRTFWQVYVNIRSSENSQVRVQRRVNGLESEEAAIKEEKRILADLSKQVVRLEGQGTAWEKVIDRWEDDKRKHSLDHYALTTINDYAALLRNYTKEWFGRPAQELNRADGRDLLRSFKEQGKNFQLVRRLKNTINQIYEWGIEERLIVGVHHSPVYGIDLGKEKETKVPEILSLIQIRQLLEEAHAVSHKWLSVWIVALLTGLRSGELHALRWTNVEMVSEEDARRNDEQPPEKRRYGLLRVVETWNTRFKKYGPTKGGYWRTVPISKDLYWFLVELKKTTGGQEFVLPRFWEWDKGGQANILREFCVSQGLKSIKFHTLRACFATQLISSGIAPSIVMKICGWRDLKTMQRYIRMAGIDEQGATEGLDFLSGSAVLPGNPKPAKSVRPRNALDAENQAMDRVVSLLEFKALKSVS